MAMDRSRTETTRDFTAHARWESVIGRGEGLDGEGYGMRTFLGHGLLCEFVVAGWECGRTDGRATGEV